MLQSVQAHGEIAHVFALAVSDYPHSSLFNDTEEKEISKVH